MHFQLLICRTQFLTGCKNWSRREPVTWSEDSGPVYCSLSWASYTAHSGGAIDMPIEGMNAHFSCDGMVVLPFLKPCWNSLHSWAADKTLVIVSLSRDLTSSAVVIEIQTAPELWCFNYSLSHSISLFRLSKRVPKLIQSIVKKVKVHQEQAALTTEIRKGKPVSSGQQIQDCAYIINCWYLY